MLFESGPERDILEQSGHIRPARAYVLPNLKRSIIPAGSADHRPGDRRAWYTLYPPHGGARSCQTKPGYGAPPGHLPGWCSVHGRYAVTDCLYMQDRELARYGRVTTDRHSQRPGQNTACLRQEGRFAARPPSRDRPMHFSRDGAAGMAGFGGF